MYEQFEVFKRFEILARFEPLFFSWELTSSNFAFI